MGDEEKKRCTNCHQLIAASSFVTHEVHCHRHIELCSRCNEPVRRTEMAQHHDEYHKTVSCELCFTQLEIGNLDRHRAEECPKRQTKCHYCEMDMAMDALKEHQSYCGTRTESCLKCGNRIMLRDQARHEESNCTYPAPRSPPPARRSPLSRSPPPARRNNNAAAAAAHPAPAAGRARGARAGGDRLANRQQHRQQSPPHLPPPPPPAVAREARRGTGRGGSGVRQPKNRNNHNSSGMYNEDSEDLGYLLNQLDTPVGSSSRDRTGGFNPYERPVMLPCERCQQSFPLEQFAFHQATCNFGFNDEVPFGELAADSDDDASVVPTAATRRDNADGHRVREHNNPNASDETLLPCEVCGETFPMDDFIMHQTVCQSGENVDIRVKPKVPNSVSKKPDVNVSRVVEPDATEGMLMIPCEFCGEAFTDETLYAHQSNCDADMGRTSRLDFVRNVHNNYDNDYLARLDGARQNSRAHGSSRPLQPKVTNQNAATRYQQVRLAEAPRMGNQYSVGERPPQGARDGGPRLRGQQQQQGPIVREASVMQPPRPSRNNDLRAAPAQTPGGSRQQASKAAATVNKPLNPAKGAGVLGCPELMERYGLQDVLTINNDRSEVPDNRNNAALPAGAARNGEGGGANRRQEVGKNQMRGNNLRPREEDGAGIGRGTRNKDKASSSRDSIQVGDYTISSVKGHRTPEGASSNGKKTSVKSNLTSRHGDYSDGETTGMWSANAGDLSDADDGEDLYRRAAVAPPLTVGRGRASITSLASSQMTSPRRPLPSTIRPGAPLSVGRDASGVSRPASSTGKGHSSDRQGHI